jgi:hypothetical protein
MVGFLHANKPAVGTIPDTPLAVYVVLGLLFGPLVQSPTLWFLS